jgi:hypothetical protein
MCNYGGLLAGSKETRCRRGRQGGQTIWLERTGKARIHDLSDA